MSPQNHPIFIRTFDNEQDELKYHYIAHTSLDVIEERVTAGGKSAQCYLGLLYAMEDVAVYGYITPLKMKIVLALALSDAEIRETDITSIFKAMHMAYYSAVSNPFLRLGSPAEGVSDPSQLLLTSRAKWRGFRERVDEISRAIGNIPAVPQP
jgi:hypothetical protein